MLPTSTWTEEPGGKFRHTLPLESVPAFIGEPLDGRTVTATPANGKPSSSMTRISLPPQPWTAPRGVPPSPEAGEVVPRQSLILLLFDVSAIGRLQSRHSSIQNRRKPKTRRVLLA